MPHTTNRQQCGCSGHPGGSAQEPYQKSTVAVDPRLLRAVAESAAARGLSTETLVNLWLQERVSLAPPTNEGQHGYG